MTRYAIIISLAGALAALVVPANAARAQVAVTLPVISRPPSNTDGLRRQQDTLRRSLESQQKARQMALDKIREAETQRQNAELDRRWNTPVTPYDRPVGALPLRPQHP